MNNFFNEIKESLIRGYKWIGTDGIINMETSALLMIVLMLFFPIFWSAFITFFSVITKCTFDKTNGHKDETHDFICAMIGVLVGLILGVI